MWNKYRKNIDRIGLSNRLLIIGFLGMLLFPAIQSSFKIFPDMPSFENRKPADKPEFKWEKLDPYPVAYEKYYADHFSLRNQLIRLKSILGVVVFHQSPMPDKVIVGKENWLFTVKDELDHYEAKNLFTTAQLESISREMVKRKRYLDQKNIQLYFVVAPTKYTIYPEYLPSFVNKLNNISRTDQVLKALEDKGIKVIDLRKPLKDAKGENLLYFKTDNHWNPYGGIIASAKIIERIKNDYPSIPIPSLSDYNITQISVKGGNTAQMLNLDTKFDDISFNLEPKTEALAKEEEKVGYPVPEFFPNPWDYEHVYESHNQSLPNILVIRDSFGNAVIPFLSQSFNRSVYIFDGWNYMLNEPIVQNESPDIMIYLMLECLWDGFIIGMNKSKEFEEAK